MGETAIPSWLTEKFLSTSLQDGQEGSTIKVRGFSADLAAPAGNNYGSYVLRVKVKFTTGSNEPEKSISLIIKSPVTAVSDAVKEMLADVVDIESLFYYEYLPLARKITEINFAPKTYFSSVPAVVVLEDLKEKGFVMPDRHKQLDLNHCQLYAVASATFHAVSAAVYKTNHQVLESIGKEKMFSNSAACAVLTKKLIPQGLEFMAEYMDKTEFKKYSSVVRKASSSLWELIVESHKPRKVLNTINQGDPWVTNMMFKYDKLGNVSEVKLLDFQALRWGSPLNDLVVFLWCGANNDVRDHDYEKFFHLYCDTLNSKLQEYGCSEKITYTELMEGVKSLSPVSLLLVATSIPIQLYQDAMDLDEMLSERRDSNGKVINNMAKFFHDDYCDTYLSRHLKQMKSFGVFEFLEDNCV